MVSEHPAHTILGRYSEDGRPIGTIWLYPGECLRECPLRARKHQHLGDGTARAFHLEPGHETSLAGELFAAGRASGVCDDCRAVHCLSGEQCSRLCCPCRRTARLEETS